MATINWRSRLRDAFRFEDGEPHEWRDVAVFLVGSAWGVMVTLGLLLAFHALGVK